MEIQLSTVIRNIHGNPLKGNELVDKVDENGEVERDGQGNALQERKDLTLADVLIEAYLTPETTADGRNRPLVAKENLHRMQMARKIDANQGGSMQIEVEEVAKLKELISKAWGAPLVAGQAIELLDPPKPKDDEKAN
jgi:hypothetical protein